MHCASHMHATCCIFLLPFLLVNSVAEEVFTASLASFPSGNAWHNQRAGCIAVSAGKRFRPALSLTTFSASVQRVGKSWLELKVECSGGKPHVLIKPQLGYKGTGHKKTTVETKDNTAKQQTTYRETVYSLSCHRFSKWCALLSEWTHRLLPIETEDPLKRNMQIRCRSLYNLFNQQPERNTISQTLHVCIYAYVDPQTTPM